jgi:hypothetical protein
MAIAGRASACRRRACPRRFGRALIAGVAWFALFAGPVGCAPEPEPVLRIGTKYHERIFGLFERADTRADGTGVGLAIARRVVKIHGGRLWVESEPGRGSRFWLSLPATDIVDRGARSGPA